MICSTCGKVGDPYLFSKTNLTKDGTRARCKECKSIMDKKYRETHKDKLAQYFVEKWKDPERVAKNRLYKERNRFGFDATEYVQDKVCIKCGMNNNECRDRYGERLSLHHPENTGRHFMKIGLIPNNEILEVMCKGCHTGETVKGYDRHHAVKKMWKTRKSQVIDGGARNEECS